MLFARLVDAFKYTGPDNNNYLTRQKLHDSAAGLALIIGVTPFGLYCKKCQNISIGSGNVKSSQNHIYVKNHLLTHHCNDGGYKFSSVDCKTFTNWTVVEHHRVCTETNVNIYLTNEELSGYSCGGCEKFFPLMQNLVRHTNNSNNNCSPDQYYEQKSFRTTCHRVVPLSRVEELRINSSPMLRLANHNETYDYMELEEILSELVPKNEEARPYAPFMYPLYKDNTDDFVATLEKMVSLWSVQLPAPFTAVVGDVGDNNNYSQKKRAAVGFGVGDGAHFGDRRVNNFGNNENRSAIAQRNTATPPSQNTPNNPTFVQTMDNFVLEKKLEQLLEVGKFWIYNHARLHTESLPGNLRSILQVFEGQDTGDKVQNMCYTVRFGLDKMWEELQKLLMYAWRHPTTKLIDFVKTMTSIESSNVVPSILVVLFLEQPSGFNTHSILIEYCISRCFLKGKRSLKMVCCGPIATIFACVLSVVRAGVCSFMMQIARKDSIARDGVTMASKSRFVNIIAPMICRLRSMDDRKPARNSCCATVGKDIIVDNFEFLKNDWSMVVPKVYQACCELLQKLFVDNLYEVFLDTADVLCVNVTVSYNFDMTTTFGNGCREVCARRDLVHSFSSERDFLLCRLRSYMELAFHGFGGGSTRYAELTRMKKMDVRWFNHTIYYKTIPIKIFSLRSQSRCRLKKKMIDHKLPRNIARIFLLYRVAVDADVSTRGVDSVDGGDNDGRGGDVSAVAMATTMPIDTNNNDNNNNNNYDIVDTDNDDSDDVEVDAYYVNNVVQFRTTAATVSLESLTVKHPSQLFFPPQSAASRKHKMTDAVTELFNFHNRPTAIQVRHLWTSISNLTFPDTKEKSPVVSATDAAAELCAHSSSTHRNIYGTELIGGTESIFALYHEAIGCIENQPVVLTKSNDVMLSNPGLGFTATVLYNSKPQAKPVFVPAPAPPPIRGNTYNTEAVGNCNGQIGQFVVDVNCNKNNINRSSLLPADAPMLPVVLPAVVRTQTPQSLSNLSSSPMLLPTTIILNPYCGKRINSNDINNMYHAKDNATYCDDNNNDNNNEDDYDDNPFLDNDTTNAPVPFDYNDYSREMTQSNVDSGSGSGGDIFLDVHQRHTNTVATPCRNANSMRDTFPVLTPIPTPIHVTTPTWQNARQVMFKNSLLPALKQLKGNDASFTSDAQRDMIVAAALTTDRHTFVGIPCGSGKSFSWIVPVCAAVAMGHTIGMMIVVVPYNCLVHHLEHAANQVLQGCNSRRVVVGSLSMRDCNQTCLPELLQDECNLPDLLFLNVDALCVLQQQHMAGLGMLSRNGKIHRFFIDEIHTIYGENFRPSYECLRNIASLRVPVMCLSGSLPIALTASLCRYLNLSVVIDDDLNNRGRGRVGRNSSVTNNNISEGVDIDMIFPQEGSIVGAFPPGFRFNVTQVSNLGQAAADKLLLLYRDESVVGGNDGGGNGNGIINGGINCPDSKFGVHVICAYVNTTTELEDLLSTSLMANGVTGVVIVVVTSNTDYAEQIEITKKWNSGLIDILISTTCALVGNENPRCRHVYVVGELYNLMNVVQAIGRLRQNQRTNAGSFEMFINFVTVERLVKHDERDGALRQTLLDRGLLTGSDNGKCIQYYNNVCTGRGLIEWATVDTGCRIIALNRRFGLVSPPTLGSYHCVPNHQQQLAFVGSPCNICDCCLGTMAVNIVVPVRQIPVDPIQQMQRQALQQQEVRNINANRALKVLHKLETMCIVCDSNDCIGEQCMPRSSCFRCGDGHYGRNCPYAAVITRMLQHRGCFFCLDLYNRRGYVNHKPAERNCPLKRRLKCLLIREWHKAINDENNNNVNLRYDDFLSTILCDTDHFYAFLANMDT